MMHQSADAVVIGRFKAIDALSGRWPMCAAALVAHHSSSGAPGLSCSARW
jgi:hypothetical protein